MLEETHVVMTKEVRKVLEEWALDFDAAAKKFKRPEIKEKSEFLRGLQLINTEKGASINIDALHALRFLAASNSINEVLALTFPGHVLADMRREARVVSDWLNKHGVTC